MPLEAEGNCSTPCVGDTGQTCGSTTHVQAFEATSPIDITVDASPKVVQAGDTVTVNTHVQTSSSSYNVRMDYGDDAGKSVYISSAANPDLSRTYYMAGEYSITAYANSADLSLTVSVLFRN